MYYGDENGMEGHIDPFCRQCFDWEHQNKDLFEFYAKLGEIRQTNQSVFKNGNFEVLYIKDGFILYKREIENDCIYI